MCSTNKIKIATLNDGPSIQLVFRLAITETCGNDYSSEQLQTWAHALDHPARLNEKIQRDYFLILWIDSECAGFASLDNDLVDLLYVSPFYQRRGFATMLYKKLEERVLEKQFFKIRTYASTTAAPFFQRMGFKHISSNTELINNLSIPNWIMEKKLAHP